MENRLTTFTIILCFFGLINLSCESDNQLDTMEIELDLGQTYQVLESDLKLKFFSINSDSRCPTGLVCIWEGNAEVTFNFQNMNEVNSDFILNTNGNFRNDTLINGYRIKLIKVLPYPEYNKEINEEDYTVEIEINKE